MATLKFKAKVLKPRKGGSDFEAFLILPKDISDCLPRRGRTTVDVSFSGYNFRVTLEPDGDLSHWLKLSSNDIASGNIRVGLENIFEICPVAVEPEPNVPKDLIDSIQNSSKAFQSWENTTTIARVDWIHWIESAKQVKTREKRISDACRMLSEGKLRVCCFDNSGFYSKALKAPNT